MQEQVGMAMLPSETRVSRAGFFSRLQPSDYFGKNLPGGEIAACDRLLKRLLPNFKNLSQWEVNCAQVPFAFRSANEKIFGVVFDFADAVGHASAWEIDLLADLVKGVVKAGGQSLATAAGRVRIVDNGGPRTGHFGDFSDRYSCRTASRRRQRIPVCAIKETNHRSADANHAFHLRARDLGYDHEGYWVFPKRGFSFRLQAREGGAASRFRPAASRRRHSGLSAFEIFVPIAHLTSRKRQFRVTLAPKIIGTFQVGVPTQLVVDVLADSAVGGLIEIGEMPTVCNQQC